jgi:DNA-directed RNA polymerase specialized sigma24 family protein
LSPITESQLRVIVERYGRGLTLFARQWCTNPDDALQEALIDLVDLTEMPQSISAWLFKAVRYKALTQSRAERRRTNHHSSAAEQKRAWFDVDPSVGLDGEMVTGLLTGLPELERQIVTSRIWGELSFVEIAELVDRPVTTVFRIYRSTLTRLREHLGVADSEPDTSTDTNIELRGQS